MASKHEGEGTEKTSNNFVTTQVSKWMQQAKFHNYQSMLSINQLQSKKRTNQSRKSWIKI